MFTLCRNSCILSMSLWRYMCHRAPGVSLESFNLLRTPSSRSSSSKRFNTPKYTYTHVQQVRSPSESFRISLLSSCKTDTPKSPSLRPPAKYCVGPPFGGQHTTVLIPRVLTRVSRTSHRGEIRRLWMPCQHLK